MDAVAEGMSGDLHPSVVQLRKINRRLASGLALHLGIPSKKWIELTADDIDDELIQKLEDAELRCTFEGTCEICQGLTSGKGKQGPPRDGRRG